ncbi:MAG: PA2778 family cysteine peptidase [Pseudomonadota bacterium]
MNISGPLIAALTLALAACSTPQTRELEKHWPLDLAATTQLKSVPFFAQELYQCGPAALATVLNYRGVAITPAELVDEIFIPGREGTLRLEIIAAARSRGLMAYPIPGKLPSLFAELDAGNPVIVMQNLGLDWAPYWHFAVAVGYSRERKNISLRSGTIRHHEIPFATFERTWERADYWAAVVASPDAAPVSAEPLGFLRAAYALEDRDHAHAASRAYETAFSVWPENELVALTTGNAAYARGDLTTAEARFRSAVSINPSSVAGWNNLSNILVQRDCAEQAVVAAQCAIALAPDNSDVRETFDTVQRLSGQDQVSRQCAPVLCVNQ